MTKAETKDGANQTVVAYDYAYDPAKRLNTVTDSGSDARNLVTIQQNPANSPVMRGYENQVRSAVEQGQVVRYSATPIYNGSELAPRGITINGSGSQGFTLDVTVFYHLA